MSETNIGWPEMTEIWPKMISFQADGSRRSQEPCKTISPAPVSTPSEGPESTLVRPSKHVHAGT
jgi:hypothetical protein